MLRADRVPITPVFFDYADQLLTVPIIENRKNACFLGGFFAQVRMIIPPERYYFRIYHYYNNIITAYKNIESKKIHKNNF